MKPCLSQDSGALRRAAEVRLKERTTARPPQTEADRRRLQHELEVHQIELEMQNEELVASQAEIAGARDRYAGLYDFAPVGYFSLSADGVILRVNLTGARLIGSARGRLVGRGFRPLVAGASQRTFKDFLARVFASATKQTCDLTLAKTAAGENLIVQLEATLAPDHTECRAVMLDITGRRRAEDQVRTSLAQVGELKQALDEHAIVAVTDARGKITFVNDMFCAISKYSRAELLGQDHRLINSGFHPKEFIRDLWTTITQGKVWQGEIKNRAKDGSFYWVATTIVPFLDDEGGKPRQYIAIRADITARKQAEEKLRRQEEVLRLLVEHSPAAIAMLDREMNYIVASRRYVSDYDLGEQNLVGRCHYEVFPEMPDRWKKIHRRCLAGAIERCEEDPFPRADGRLDWVRWEIRPWNEVDERIGGIILFSEVITARKQAEDKLRELGTQLNRAEEAERRRIARELHDSTGQKLAALSMTVGLLQDGATAPTDRTRKMFADSMTLVEECAEEIRTLSYLLHPPLLDELGLAAAIGDYVAGFTKRSNVRVAFESSPDFARLPDAVEVALFRVVQESLGNIRRHARTSAARISLVAEAEQVLLEISDPGGGMSAKTLRAIQAERGSPGVGIAGMHERLRLVGGRMEIGSGKRGTTIRAIVPAPESK